ncbi:MAG TPA: ATP-binding protein [Polyangiaceae bacterium]
MEAVSSSRLAHLVSVVRSLSLARSVEDVQVVVRRAARELTGADGATFVLRDGDNCYYADEDAIAPLWKGSRFPMSACISGWVMIHREPALIRDIYADERIPADAYRPTFVKSLAMVPIRRESPIGAIGNYWAQERMPTAEELELLQALADSTSVALENVRLYGELEATIRERTAALEAARYELEERKRAQAELARTETQLRHAQKMEAIGRLAGGIAHDFNNLLSVVLSYSSMTLAELNPNDPMRGDIEQIQRAGERGALLTRQLLAMSRQQVFEPQMLDLNEVVRGMERMVRRLLGEDVRFESRLGKRAQVFADQGQIEQVLMNLIINARDAMPRGGCITVETTDVHLNGDYSAAHIGVEVGDYVMVAVSDTGIGMDSETQSRIFEPFFTTKDKTKGTGLGLSTVYGIVRQCGGHVWVYSELGQGTTFKLYFPRRAANVSLPQRRPVDIEQLTGTETVLLVEDDDQVRDAAKGILYRSGYNVLAVSNAGEALLLCEQFSGTIHMLVTDVVMPMMNGAQLATRLVQTRPNMKVLCMSGYTDEAVLSHGFIDSKFAFLQKPITPESLLVKVRQVFGD